MGLKKKDYNKQKKCVKQKISHSVSVLIRLLDLCKLAADKTESKSGWDGEMRLFCRTSFKCQRNILTSTETAQHWQSCSLFIPGGGAAHWVWFLRDNHPSCSDPLKNASTSPRCHVPPQNSGLETKGCISGSGSHCPSSRHGLCNGPLMAATNDQQPEALPPETLRHRLLTSTDSVCSSMLCDGDSTRGGSPRRLSKVHSLWDISCMCVCLATHTSPV